MPVARNPLRRAIDALRGGRLLRRTLPNFIRDLPFGGYLGGSIPTRFRERDAHNVESTDWWDLDRMFAHPDAVPLPGEVIVDVGCGKGRALAYFVRATRARNRIVGIELDPDVARATRDRFRAHPQVEVIAGDATQLMPRDATLVYMCNPFGPEVVRRFAELLVAEAEGLEHLRIVYWNSAYVEIFQDLGWQASPLPASTRAALLRPPLAP
jgi:SAM-dependent methyltransferase